MTTDAAFFAEWHAHRFDVRRSTRRAGELLSILDIGPRKRCLTVVGSKGKGTTAIYASAYIAAAGHRVVSITSPSFLRSTERIRVNGSAVSAHELRALGRRISQAVTHLEAPGEDGGYLSPSGLFIIAGFLHASDIAADFVVLEAGRGGLSDEASLFDPDVVAITQIFGEHVDELGGSIGALVEDKCGVITDTTRAVFSVPQPKTIERLVSRAVLRRSNDRLVPEVLGPSRMFEIPAQLMPSGLGRVNGMLGCVTARQLLDESIRPGPDLRLLTQTLQAVSLPGRLSLHKTPDANCEVIIDAAVSRTGFAAALTYAHATWGKLDHVLLSLPDDKDIDGARIEFAGAPVTFVRLDRSYLTYTRQRSTEWGEIHERVLDLQRIQQCGTRILAVGTISFVALMLGLLGASTERAY